MTPMACKLVLVIQTRSGPWVLSRWLVPALVALWPIDPCPDTGDREAKAAQDSAEESVHLHAIASPALGDDLLEQVLGIQRQEPVLGVMEAYGLKRDPGEIALLKLSQEAECVPAMTVDTPRVSNMVKVSAKLGLCVGRHGHARTVYADVVCEPGDCFPEMPCPRIFGVCAWAIGRF